MLPCGQRISFNIFSVFVFRYLVGWLTSNFIPGDIATLLWHISVSKRQTEKKTYGKMLVLNFYQRRIKTATITKVLKIGELKTRHDLFRSTALIRGM